MKEPHDNGPNAYAAYMVVAFISAVAAVVIALIALNKFTQVTDSGMWSMAVMILAPTVLGVGVSYFIHRTAAVTRRGAGPVPSLPATEVQEGSFRAGRPTEGRSS